MRLLLALTLAAVGPLAPAAQEPAADERVAASPPSVTQTRDARAERSAAPSFPPPAGPREVPQDVLDDLRTDPDYQYDSGDAEAAVSWDERFRRWLMDKLQALFEGGDDEQVGRVISWIFYGLAALVVGWALLKLIRMDGTSPLARGGHTAAAAADDHADAERPAADLTALVDEAARAGRYHEAVRWQYLRLLGALGRAGLLDLQPSKTNRRYRADLAGHALGADFARASRLFDRVVYGGVELDGERYAAVADRLAEAETRLADFAGSPEPVAVA